MWSSTDLAELREMPLSAEGPPHTKPTLSGPPFSPSLSFFPSVTTPTSDEVCIARRENPGFDLVAQLERNTFGEENWRNGVLLLRFERVKVCRERRWDRIRDAMGERREEGEPKLSCWGGGVSVNSKFWGFWFLKPRNGKKEGERN